MYLAPDSDQESGCCGCPSQLDAPIRHLPDAGTRLPSSGLRDDGAPRSVHVAPTRRARRHWQTLLRRPRRFVGRWGCRRRLRPSLSTTYLAFAVDRTASFSQRSLLVERPKVSCAQTFATPTLPMAWDFAETQPVQSTSSGNFGGSCRLDLPSRSVSLARKWLRICRSNLTRPTAIDGMQRDSSRNRSAVLRQHWLRGPLRLLLRLAATIARCALPRSLQHAARTPKAQELVADPIVSTAAGRGRGVLRGRASRQSFHAACAMSQPARYPLTLFYAFKQSEAR